MEAEFTPMEALFERAEIYGQTIYELAKLRTVEVATAVTISLVSKLAVAIMAVLFTLVVNVGIALWLGELLGKAYYGFFIVAAFYLILGIVLYFFLAKWISKPISDLFIKRILQ